MPTVLLAATLSYRGLHRGLPVSPVTDGNGESRPRHVTQRDIWESLEAIRTETREARHSQNNLFQRAIAESAATVRGEIGAVDVRVRSIEQALAAATPSTLGQRLGDVEKWQAVISSTNLPGRMDVIESTLDQMRGSLNALKYVQIVLALAGGVIAVVTFLRPQVPV